MLSYFILVVLMEQPGRARGFRVINKSTDIFIIRIAKAKTNTNYIGYIFTCIQKFF